jgi:two-component sensor histidine kinase
MTLIVADDGKGLPDGFSIETANSLGFTIIDSLIDQLEGTVKQLNQRGAAFQIEFDRFENSKV